MDAVQITPDCSEPAATGSEYLDHPLRSLEDAVLERGRRAFQQGLMIEDCPFKSHHLRAGWREGWLAATPPQAKEKSNG